MRQVVYGIVLYIANGLSIAVDAALAAVQMSKDNQMACYSSSHIVEVQSHLQQCTVGGSCRVTLGHFFSRFALCVCLCFRLSVFQKLTKRFIFLFIYGTKYPGFEPWLIYTPAGLAL